MSFWNAVKSDLKKAVEEGWSAVKDGAKVAAEKSEEVAKTGKLKYKAHILHKDAEKLFADLGGLIYDLANGRSQKNPLSNPEVRRLVKEIGQLEDSASVMEDDITNIKLHNVKSTLQVSSKPKAASKKTIKKKTATKAAPKKAAKKKGAIKKKTIKKKTIKKAAPKKTVKKKTVKK
ncbi:MAG: hypothetical protein V3V95_07270 [Thermodesulfobacteriota bacterium]